jgi:hypothetical protein
LLVLLVVKVDVEQVTLHTFPKIHTSEPSVFGWTIEPDMLLTGRLSCRTLE